MLLINGIKLRPGEDENKLKSKIEKKLRHPIRSFEIRKKSLDARRDPFFVYSVIVDIDNEKRYLSKDVTLYHKDDLKPEFKQRNSTCVVAGYGPSGIFAALRLLEAGFQVHVFEKGKRIIEREKDVERFFKEGILDPSSNVQFGEGGAGTFSDAKLTTRIKDRYIDYILDSFIEHGASESIRYENHAHIGTDEIRKIIASLTDDMIARGVIFHFEEEMTEIILNESHEVTGIRTRKGEYPCDHLLLGVGEPGAAFAKNA